MIPENSANSLHAGQWLYTRLACVASICLLFSCLYRYVYIDDAFIYARYISNALQGHGFVFNLGEHVNALSSPLYSYLVLLFGKTFGQGAFNTSVVVSAVAFLFACSQAEVMVPFSGLLLASTSYFYSFSGMETSLFLALLLLPVLLVQRQRTFWLPTVALLLVLTRFEGLAMAPPLFYVVYRQGRLPPWRSLLPPCLIAMAYLLLNLRWYGALLPASAGAKLGQGRSGFWGQWPYAFTGGAYQLKPDFLPILPLVVAVTLFVLPGCLLLRRSVLLQITLPTLLLLLTFYVLFNLPGYRWYFAPFIAFAMIYATAVVSRWPKGRWIPILLVCFLVGTSLHKNDLFARKHQSHSAQLQGYPAIGLWLAAHTVPGTRVEAGEIGTLGWFCPNCRIIDILGLTYPKNAEHIARRDNTSWFAEDVPEYIVVHRPPWGFEMPAVSSPKYAPVPVDFGSSVRLLQRLPSK